MTHLHSSDNLQNSCPGALKATACCTHFVQSDAERKQVHKTVMKLPHFNALS